MTADQVRELRKQLIINDEPLKAYLLLKKVNLPELHPEVERTYSMIRHIFDYDFYKKYYSESLPEIPSPEEHVLLADQIYPRWNWVLNKLSEEGAKTMLDVGCSDGVLTLTASSRGVQSHGINLYKPSIELAKQRAERLALKNATFEAVDLLDMTEKKYDAVVAMEIIEHVPSPAKFLDRLNTLRSENGWVYLTTPNGCFDKGDGNRPDWDCKGPQDVRGHVRVYTKESMEKQLEGWEIKELSVNPDNLLYVQARKI